MDKLSVFVINMEKRVDRKFHALREFEQRAEFDFSIVKAIEHTYGTIRLWKTISQILTESIPENPDYIIICEDDHQFTKSYSRKKLMEAIIEAKSNNADLLLGGVSWFNVDTLLITR